jgi:hypothetical protein
MQTHPEISITFRRDCDGNVLVQTVSRRSKDEGLSNMAQAYAKEIGERMPAITKKLVSEAQETQEVH